MSTASFIKFYSEFLPKNPELKAKIDGAGSPKEFAAAVMEHGKKAGFEFSEDELDQVMIASLQKHGAGELGDAQLEGVVGGAGTLTATPTIQVSPIKSLVTLPKGGTTASTLMCPGWMPAGTSNPVKY